MKYIYKYQNTKKIHKFGVDMSIFNPDSGVGVVFEVTEVGHFEEWYSETSTHHWFIIEGYGTFVIDDEKVEVEQNDLVVIPPNKKIHYFGKLKMLLITQPNFNEANEHHVRDIPQNESPYLLEEESR